MDKLAFEAKGVKSTIYNCGAACLTPRIPSTLTMKLIGLMLMMGAALGDKAPYPASGAPSGPYPPSGWKPNGPLLLLPQEEYGPPPSAPPSSPPEYGPPPAAPSPPPSEYGPPQNGTTPSNEEDLEKVNERIMERLRKEEGSDTGVYYVYLPDGRLQRVQYTTAPLKAASTSQQTSFINTQQSNQQGFFGDHQVSTQSNTQTFGNFGSFAKQQTSYDAPLYPPSPASGQAYSQAAFRSAQSDGTPKVKDTPGSPENLLAKFTKHEQLVSVDSKPPQPSKYVASVSFTDVAPISGPVYTYANQPLARVLRNAPILP